MAALRGLPAVSVVSMRGPLAAVALACAIGILGAGEALARKAGRTPAQILSSLGVATDADSLVAALDDENPMARENAAHVLGGKLDPKVVRALEAHLDDGDLRVRIAIAGALMSASGGYRSQAARQLLLGLLADIAEGSTRVLALATFCEKAGPRSDAEQALLSRAASYLSASGQWTIRRQLVRTVRRCFVSPIAYERLTAMLADPNRHVRSAAIEALGEAKDPTLTPQLIALLRHADPTVRFAANHYLEQQTGQRFFFSHVDPPDRREEAIDAWEAWWQRIAEAGKGP